MSHPNQPAAPMTEERKNEYDASHMISLASFREVLDKAIELQAENALLRSEAARAKADALQGLADEALARWQSMNSDNPTNQGRIHECEYWLDLIRDRLRQQPPAAGAEGLVTK